MLGASDAYGEPKIINSGWLPHVDTTMASQSRHSSSQLASSMLKLKEESIEPIDEFSADKVETGQKQSIASVLALQVTTTAVCSG